MADLVATSDKHRPREDAKTWDSFKPSKTGYQAVFKAAQERGWVNPKSNAAQVATAPTTLAQRKPHNIFGRTRPQPFELDEAPRPIAELADAYSRAKGADRSGVIVAAVTAAAAMIDDRFVLRALPDWLVSARMWSFICAPSGEGKSPILRAATDPIKLLHAEALGKWRANNEFRKEQDRDPIPALYTSDATVPALSERLKDNPRGIFMLTEEFSSWIGSIEASNRGDAAKNRGDSIQLRDGGGLRQVDRVGRGSVSVSNWGASVLAACTPDGLAKQLKNMPEDGLIGTVHSVHAGRNGLRRGRRLHAQLEMWERWMKWDLCQHAMRGAVCHFHG